MLKADVLVLMDSKKAEMLDLISSKMEEMKSAVDSIVEAASDSDLQKKIEELQAQVVQLQADKDALSASLAKDEDKIAKASADLSA